MNRLELTNKDGKTKTVWAQRLNGKIWIHLDGQVWTMEEEASTRRRKSSSSSTPINDGSLVSPMPGKIWKLPVQEGDSISEGDIAVVLEAMKMEYSLKAPFNGVVEKVRVAEGDQVGLGDLLVKIASEETGDTHED